MGGGRGRGNRSRTQRKHFRDGRENVWKRAKSHSSSDPNNTSTDNPTWQPFATQNQAFDEYYKEQGIVASEEWDTFVEVLRTPLPAAFRINSSSQFCADIRSQLEDDFMKSLKAEFTDGGEVEAIRPLPWYPDNLAWHSNFSRMQLRKNQTLERFHEFLKLENEIGNITRQEAVSMVPPLFLDVCPNHFVLDMCAAPGSKTFQLLEIIYQSTKAGSLPDGMVIANDLDVQRSPIRQLLFDRVLCDVPCSGDGTLRKAPDLWRKWNSGMGNGLHNLQIQIAMRGLSLLKVGGRMVYSTCSMNPVENEAVVAEILRRCGGSVELVDVSKELPQLVRRPGLRKWKVRDKGIWLFSHKDVSKFRRFGILPVIQEKPSRRGNLLTKKDELQEKLSEQVTECNNGVELNSEDAASENFSEAASEADLIEKETDKATLEPDPCNTDDENDSEEAHLLVDGEIPSGKAVGKRKLQIQGKWKGVDPVIFFKDEAIINSIKGFYVKDVLELNLLVGQQLKISSVGLKMFERQTSREGTTAPCSFRISSEGLPVILPHITKQILYASPVDFKHLLQYKAVKFMDFVDAEFGEKASKLMMGCCVIVLRDAKTLSDPIQLDASTIAIGCWKGRASLSVMVTAIDCQELLERLSARMETERCSFLQENNVEADDVQDMNEIEKVEESETAEEATNG
ncbi:hypothetical protein GH714_040852 [Hevea brasiliensis]|uniref:SAM-dependent MTase RsmB/NOP-type domain-containing protein n=1 Tax=Hevea brasiliensis TaxID=3981 RepID=A0A6A6MSQ7_HEVBR|nr:hypothetical protein GH714_040852 [Hevea brasiliensis]